MLINTLPSQVTSGRSPQTGPGATLAQPEMNEPIDSWNPGESKAMAALAPYSGLALGGAAGLIGGMANGVAGGLGGAFALGAAGATAATILSGFDEMSGNSPNYSRNALLGAGVGAAVGAFVGSATNSAVLGVGLALVGAAGAKLGLSFMAD